MRRTRGWTGLRTMVGALGLAVAAAGVARADSITSTTDGSVPTSTLLAYDTVGSTIGTTGVTGSPAISFVPVAGGTFLSPSNLSLGEFETRGLTDGQTVTYNNTPFHIMFNVDKVNGASTFLPNQTPVDISGTLNGTISGPNQSSVVATFDKPTTLASTADPSAYSFATGLYANTLKITDNPISVVPSGVNNGQSTVQALLSTDVVPPVPSPEPSTVVLFAATIAGLGFRHRLRRGRSAA